MALYGSLRTMPLADVLQWLKTTNKAGELNIKRDGHEWQLRIAQGNVSGYLGPEIVDRLDQLIVNLGLLSEDDLRVAYHYQREHGGSFKSALDHSGLLSLPQINDTLRELALESIYDLFVDLPGDFVFTDDVVNGIDLKDTQTDFLPLDLDANHLLMEAAKRQDDWDTIRQRLGDDELNVEIVEEKMPAFDSLTVRQRRILAGLHAGHTIADISFELRAPVTAILHTLVGLEETGALLLHKGGIHEKTPGRQTSKFNELIFQAEVLRQARQFDEAITLLETALTLRPDATEARTLLQEISQEQLQELYALLPPLKTPVLVATEERLHALQLRGADRFLIERIAARMDIGSLVMVSSMNERETLKTLRRLLHNGVIELH